MAKKKRPKGVSPTLTLHITDENYAAAVRSSSGGCLIADAIKREYPHLSAVTVDMATIRATDRAKGERYTYLTPPAAQQLLLGYDQGWSKLVDEVSVRAAVKVTPVRAGSSTAVKRRAERKTTLEAAEQQGLPLSRAEKSALTHMRKADEIHEPREAGSLPTEVVFPRGPTASPVVVGGKDLPQGEPHPNLLRGRSRHFGAKIADPGIAWTEALEQAVAERLAEMGATAPVQQGSKTDAAAGGA
jgi:hypothetical protein